MNIDKQYFSKLNYLNHCILLEHCQLHDWSNWEWSNEEKKCGVGKRSRNIKVCPLHGGESCEKRFGNNYNQETKDVICKGKKYTRLYSK